MELILIIVVLVLLFGGGGGYWGRSRGFGDRAHSCESTYAEITTCEITSCEATALVNNPAGFASAVLDLRLSRRDPG
jgi:hypothetical protein